MRMTPYTHFLSFLKRQADGSYCWPEPENNSSVDRHDVVKMGCPQEDIISGASSTVLVKLTFDKNHIHGARLAFKVPIANVC